MMLQEFIGDHQEASQCCNICTSLMIWNLSSETAFKARAKWYEQGGKSNKNFLNLNKKQQKQKKLQTIKCDEVKYRGQEGVCKGISDYYQILYSNEDVEDIEYDFYDNCPKLSQNWREHMDTELTQQELVDALMKCTDSAPGSDGIPYSVYNLYVEPLGCCWLSVMTTKRLSHPTTGSSLL